MVCNLRAKEWRAADIELLTMYWCMGITTRRIAEILGRSKGSVIGKANRLKLGTHALKLRTLGERNHDYER